MALWISLIVNLTVPLCALLPIGYIGPIYFSPSVSIQVLCLSYYYLISMDKRLKFRLFYLFTCCVSAWLIWGAIPWPDWFDGELPRQCTAITQAALSLLYHVDPTFAPGSLILVLEYGLFLLFPFNSLQSMTQFDGFTRILFAFLVWASEVILGGIVLKDPHVDEIWLMITFIPFLRLHWSMCLPYGLLIVGFRVLHYKNMKRNGGTKLEEKKKKTTLSPSSTVPVSPEAEEKKSHIQIQIDKHEEEKPPPPPLPPVAEEIVEQHKAVVVPKKKKKKESLTENIKSIQGLRPTPHMRKRPEISPMERHLLFQAMQTPKYPIYAESEYSTPREEASSVQSKASSTIVDISKQFKNFDDYLPR